MQNDLNGKITINVDIYKGAHIRILEYISSQQFEVFLSNLLSTEHGFNSIWVYLETNNLQILGLLTNKMRFSIHHGLDKSLVVKRWLKKREDLTVPYSIFWIAAGALVIKDNKVLLVQEKGGARKGKYGLPGGRANRQELIAQCAERQLFQQTGVKAKFSRIVMIRELGKGQIYNCVDLYFVCLMQINEQSFDCFQLCKRQIKSYQWVQLQNYEQFCNQHSMGTQQLVSKHVSKLFRENKLFDGRDEYQTALNLDKKLCEHRL